MDYGQSVSALKAAHEGLKECLRAGRSGDADGMLRLIAGLEVVTTAAAHKEGVEDQAIKQRIHDAWSTGHGEASHTTFKRCRKELMKALGYPEEADISWDRMLEETAEIRAEHVSKVLATPVGS